MDGGGHGVRNGSRTVVCSENRSVVVSLMLWSRLVLSRRVADATADLHRYSRDRSLYRRKIVRAGDMTWP